MKTRRILVSGALIILVVAASILTLNALPETYCYERSECMGYQHCYLGIFSGCVIYCQSGMRIQCPYAPK